MKRLRPILSHGLHALPLVLAGGTLLCALLHVTVRDRWAYVCEAFYASPPVVMSLVLLLSAALWCLRKAWRPAIAAGGGALLAAAWWLATSLVLSPPDDSPPPRELLRGLGWNLERGEKGWDKVMEDIREFNPDLGWFVEADEFEKPSEERWHKDLAGYDRRETPGGGLLITKGRIREFRAVMKGESCIAEFRVTLRGADITVFLVDMDGTPYRSRRSAFEALDAAVASAPPGPILIGGDFNTPRNSVYFDRWRGSLTQAFEAKGRGMDGTWPTPIPFLSIDHCWVNDRIHIRSCVLPNTSTSDHRPVLVEFSIP